jgi:hypothetical protein
MVDRQWTRRLCGWDDRRQLDSALSWVADLAGRIAARMPPKSPKLNPTNNVWQYVSTTGSPTGCSPRAATSSITAARPIEISKVFRDGRYAMFQMAKVAVPRLKGNRREQGARIPGEIAGSALERHSGIPEMPGADPDLKFRLLSDPGNRYHSHELEENSGDIRR